MDTVVFNKEDFKKSVLDNVKNIYRKNIEEATKQQVFQAVAYAVKDMIIDRWIATQKEYDAITTSPTDLLKRKEREV